VAQLTKSPTKTAGFLQSSYDVITGILDRAVTRGIERRNEQNHSVQTLSIDEKAFRRGHDYLTIVSCPQIGQVCDVSLGRKQSDTEELLEGIDQQIGLDQVEAVSIDMWKAYINSMESTLPGARIVHDKFHVIAWLNKAVDLVRRKGVKSEPELKNTRYLCLEKQQDHSDKQAENFKRVSQLNLLTAQAWQIKENFKALYEQNSPIEGYHYFCQWFEDVASKGITACKKVARMCQTHVMGILNYINYLITNGRAEQVNSKIQQVKSISKGYRNFGNFRTAILFYFGKLDLYPQRFP